MAVRALVRDRARMTAMLDLGLWTRSRIRLVRQTEMAECGLACLAMIARYHGLDVDLGSLRRRFPPSVRGASLKWLIGVADQVGLSTRALRVSLEDLPDLEMPAILHWNMNHFVVAERVRRGRMLIHDPGGRSREYSLDELSDHFTGVALELHPAAGFEPADVRQRMHLSQLWGRIRGLKRVLLQTLVLSIVLQGFVLASPYYMQLAIDQALPALDNDLLLVLALGFGLFTLINALAELLRSFVLLGAGTSLSYGVTANIARHLLRLPLPWFEKRHIGDILSRFQSVIPIQQALTQGAIVALLDGLLAILTVMVMAFYSLALTGLALLAFGLYALFRWLSFAPQREAQEATIVTGAKLQSTLVETVSGMSIVRLFNHEPARQALWLTQLTDSLNANVRLARVGIWQKVANGLIFGVETVLSVWLAIGFVMQGGFSLGMVFAFMAYKTLFLTRSSSLIDQIVVFRMLALHLERISDIALANEDVSFTTTPDAHSPFRGAIELKEIVFRYSPADPIVLDRTSLIVEPGAHVAITGPSGGGKSTLARIILGLAEPDSGAVLIDGRPLARFGHQNYRSQVAGVMQDDHLFAGTIADNIALFDEAADMARILEAAAAAAIHDDIMAMPMGYETLIGNMGSSLSGGQKQRLLLARALYRRPALLLMDEGTSHLDSALETRVNQAIAALGITRIIIAHRAETIAVADAVYRLDRGKLTPAD
jgi:ATP-binding cassette subfamily B protein RaxB